MNEENESNKKKKYQANETKRIYEYEAKCRAYKSIDVNKEHFIKVRLQLSHSLRLCMCIKLCAASARHSHLHRSISFLYTIISLCRFD